MVISIMEHLNLGKRMEKEFIDGNPETNTMEIGLMIKWKVQEHIYILME